MAWYVWDSSGNSANSIHDQLQPVTSYLSMNGVDVVDSNGCQEQHVYACFGYSGRLGDGIHEKEVAAVQSLSSCRAA